MQFLATNRPITVKVLHALASERLANLGRNSITSHPNRLNLLTVGDEVDEARSGNYMRSVPKDAMFLYNRSSKEEFLKGLRFSCRLNRSNDRMIVLGGRGTYGFSNNARVAWIAEWKSNGYDGLRSSGLRARGRKLGRRDRPIYEHGVGHEPSLLSKESGNSEKSYDAILVLAGGQVAGGGVPVWVERRLDRALDLQRSNSGVLCKIVCLGGGTPHRAPILSSESFVIHESSSCAAYLHSRGVPYSHVIKEWGSYDTIGNGYFSLTQHVIPRRWRTLAVVTSEFHMPRTRAIFEWIFGLQGTGLALQVEKLGFDAVVALKRSQAQGFQLEFHSVPDNDSIDESVFQARLEREHRSIENLNILIQQIQNLEDFHEWFHTEHKAYNTQDQHLFGKEDNQDPALLSY